MRVTIRPVPGVPSRRLSVKEQALWTLQQMFPESGISNESLTIAVPGRIDREAMARQVRRLVRRYPALRTVFPERDGQPCAIILAAEDVHTSLQFVEDPPDPLEETVSAFATAPFDITCETGFRFGLWHYGTYDVFCMALHHLVFDARSGSVLFTDLVAGYNADVSGATPASTAFDVVAPYAEPAPSRESLRYWREHVAGLRRDSQAMAIGQTDRLSATFAGSSRRHQIAPETSAAIKLMSRRYRVTENIILLAAYYLLLAQHDAGPDLAVGVSVDVRDPAHQQPAVGYHVNSLPIRVGVDLTAGFDTLVSATRDAFLSGLRYRDTPYEAVLPDLWTARDSWRSPLFRYMFNYRHQSVTEFSLLGGLPAKQIIVPARLSAQDLTLTVEKGRDADTIEALYRTDLFDEVDIIALLERYDALLVTLAQAGDRALAEIRCWSPQDQVLLAANDTADDAPTRPILDTIVAAACDGTAIAMVRDDKEHTYGELLGAAAGVRDRLQTAGVRAGQVVALYADRGLPLAAAVLGIWAAGAVYLPLHQDNPADLLSFQLADAGSVVVLTDRPLPAGTVVPCPVLAIDEQRRESGMDTELAGGAAVDDTAYVIYTSGSTGRPKGVEITHRNLANVVRHFATALPATARNTMLWLSTFAFDISALELFLPLSVGGQVVVAPDEARVDAKLLLELMDKYDVGIAQATPTTWAQVAADTGGVLAGRTVLCGGEPLPPAVAGELLSTGCQLLNVYGPTETTIWSTAAVLNAERVDPVPVGTPIRNTTAFVLGRNGLELPPGAIGELCIGGWGVARGYLNLPDLTAERFRVSARHGRFYRTGDRASWWHDGMLRLYGRDDRQVKIRAHRVELGEVEAVLAEHPEIGVVAVSLRDDLSGGPGLAAFVQPRTTGTDRLREDVWRHAKERLASYALPEHIEFARLPLTPSGKVDYQALATRELVRPRRAGGKEPPKDGLVLEIIEMWREALNDPDIGPDDNFFLAGGQSLAAVRMLSSIAERTGTRLSLDNLLDHPTPNTFADYVVTAPRADE